MNKLREDVDLDKSRAQWDNAGHEKELEVSIRAKNNAWVIARVTRGKELYIVLEKANETLLYASDAVEKFSNRYFFSPFLRRKKLIPQVVLSNLWILSVFYLFVSYNCG